MGRLFPANSGLMRDGGQEGSRQKSSELLDFNTIQLRPRSPALNYDCQKARYYGNKFNDDGGRLGPDCISLGRVGPFCTGETTKYSSGGDCTKIPCTMYIYSSPVPVASIYNHRGIKQVRNAKQYSTMVAR
ncbi:hypothetical protein ASPSYDRAFT_28147 [Aspergillus sydowii CBS 593.65]|uniref:Uncharacterized protein n=1 Tax=Aspergillus sydowii CBS 593.65 TaxID=1036612 RepID=A0A1L9TSY0_9EURO|nr:uncharacterized protein ASPSYDRAFT_28147 [Aspergillus sydowii CBS 593.65]OJJ62511.1 hypothetical protein ASPSYDRAFT_28147 [Aspergillus sydowii CBS 593.65]